MHIRFISIKGHSCLLVVKMLRVFVVIEGDVAVVFGFKTAADLPRKVGRKSHHGAGHVVTVLPATPLESKGTKENGSQFS
jgi:hypothetical protein